MNGTDLKIERVRVGLKQYRLAQALGVPPTVVWQIESGRRPVTPERAAEILSAIKDLADRPSPGAGHEQAA